MHAVVLGGADDHESAAADPAQPRLDDADRERRGDRRIDRIAALAQDSRARLRRKPMLCRDHTAGGNHWSFRDDPGWAAVHHAAGRSLGRSALAVA